MKTADKIFHLLVPRESNNQKARLIHSPVLMLIIVKLIIFQIALQLMPASGLKVLGYAANISPEEVVRLTNEKRQQNGLPPLQLNEALSRAALAKGTDMINKGYWAHVSPDGIEPWKFFLDVGYKYRYAGENLARDFSDPNSAVEAWMASASHRENMLSPKYKDIGVAVVEGKLDGVETTIIVQFFGTNYYDTLPSVPVAEAGAATESSPTPAPTNQRQEPETTPAPVARSYPSPTPSSVIVGAPGPTSPPGPVGKRVLISPFSTTKSVSLLVVGLLLNVLVIDGLVASRRRISRIGGRTFAHLAFLGMILAIAIILKAGQVI